MYRKATAGDCAKIYDLICDMECRELAFDRFQEIFCNQLNSNRYYCLVNDNDDRVIAVLNLRFEEQLHHTGSEICWILVPQTGIEPTSPALRNRL